MYWLIMDGQFDWKNDKRHTDEKVWSIEEDRGCTYQCDQKKIAKSL